MKIWVTRHGQTEYNRQHLMQGRTNAPLNETGLQQARAMRGKVGSSVRFDAVYASPLDRAVTTASIIGGVDRSQIVTDERIIEVDFGKYELHRYDLLGPAMTLYWMFPEVFPAPATVETVDSMVERSHSFLRDLEEKGYQEGWDNVLVACHGGIMRALCGYLDDRKNGIMWRPKPHNCEVRIFESENGRHRYLKRIRL